ncbi:hypothetical protein LJB93_01225 [Desulfovibrio sp. OttesenSCG-928-F07]|nr:hypothetical protein [Desulfovibrio sp. OttesenSCG-928-F07]
MIIKLKARTPKGETVEVLASTKGKAPKKGQKAEVDFDIEKASFSMLVQGEEIPLFMKDVDFYYDDGEMMGTLI